MRRRQPYGEWLKENQITLDELPDAVARARHRLETFVQRQRAFGYTDEDIRALMTPMAVNGEEAIGSMGTDTPLACLSDKPQPLFNYFKQLFAQVTNPPIDPIREELVMSLTSYIGTERNILDETPQHCHTLKLQHPILTNWDLEKLRRVSHRRFAGHDAAGAVTVSMAASRNWSARSTGFAGALRCAIKSGYSLLILSDRGVDEESAPIPSLLALTAVHNHLIREGTRTQVALIIESGEPREVQHFCLLIGYGASAVNPYLAIETLEDLAHEGMLPRRRHVRKGAEELQEGHQQGPAEGLLEDGNLDAAELSRRADFRSDRSEQGSLVEKYFTGTPSRIEGVGLDVLAREAQMKHDYAFRPVTESDTELETGGSISVPRPRRVSPAESVDGQQTAACGSAAELRDVQGVHRAGQRPEPTALCTLRGLMKFKYAAKPVPIEEVEPATEIVKRFATGAMSYGSISKEAHETLAIAMNRSADDRIPVRAAKTKIASATQRRPELRSSRWLRAVSASPRITW